MERKNGEWTIKRTRKMFENEFFKVFEDEVVQPDGKDGTYATIDYLEGVAVLPLDDEGNVYLTKQFRYALGRDNLEAVAGGVEDEDALAAARREIKEEIGIEAEDWKDFGFIENDTSIARSRARLFLAQKIKFGKAESEGTEHIKPVKMKLEEAVEKVMNGEITHHHTMVLILKTHLLLAKSHQ